MACLCESTRNSTITSNLDGSLGRNFREIFADYGIGPFLVDGSAFTEEAFSKWETHAMHYEHRVQETVDGKAEALNCRFYEHGLLASTQHGIGAIEVFQTKPANGRLSYITHFPDEAAHAATWTANRTDLEWQRVNAEPDACSSLRRGQTAVVRHPTVSDLL